jgi:hypothetical protein
MFQFQTGLANLEVRVSQRHHNGEDTSCILDGARRTNTTDHVILGARMSRYQLDQRSNGFH